MLKRILITVLIAVAPALPMWAQGGMGPVAGDSSMAVPSPANIEGGSTAFGPESERSNYLRGGATFQGAYNDNLFLSSPSLRDESYTLSPFLRFSLHRSRLVWNLDYSPGFTFYQRFNSDNQANHNFSTDFQYRLSPHVTMTLRDNLAKFSDATGLLEPATSGGEEPLPLQNLSVVPPLTDTLSNTGGGEITYQFGANSMMGASGSSSELHYLSSLQVPGLFDSSERGGQAFYSHRFSSHHYIGMTYRFELMAAHPIEIQTQVHSATFFYSIYFTRQVSLSAFAGAQLSDTSGGGLLPFSEWSPAEGGTFNWQGVHTSMAVSLSHSINPGGGLAIAVRGLDASASIRHQFTRNLTGMVSGNYGTSNVLQAISQFSTGGHTLSTGASLERRIGQHLTAALGYSRLNESYSNIPAISNHPRQNRGWISFSYSFERPLGR